MRRSGADAEEAAKLLGGDASGEKDREVGNERNGAGRKPATAHVRVDFRKAHAEPMPTK